MQLVSRFNSLTGLKYFRSESIKFDLIEYLKTLPEHCLQRSFLVGDNELYEFNREIPQILVTRIKISNYNVFRRTFSS